MVGPARRAGRANWESRHLGGVLGQRASCPLQQGSDMSVASPKSPHRGSGTLAASHRELKDTLAVKPASFSQFRIREDVRLRLPCHVRWAHGLLQKREVAERPAHVSPGRAVTPRPQALHLELATGNPCDKTQEALPSAQLPTLPDQSANATRRI